ncbi:serine-threonine protein kinase, plant-type [Spatholobus suberectus]|nr:serine-threonine protein kinase, plant-type [Spatholobus suberectus]
MEGQSVVVIHDASREINVRIFEWSLRGLSLVPGNMLTLIAVLHQVITPMGYKSSVDSRLMFGANQKMIEAQAVRKKEEYHNNPELTRIFKLYKSEKVGFKIEMATGSSLKAVALKSAIKLKATWLILDRKMKNDEEYFLQKLSCGILRVRRFNKILRLRGPLHLPQETRPGSTRETYTDSIPLPDISTEHDTDLLFSIENSPSSQGRDNPMNPEERQRQKSLHGEGGCSTSDQVSTEENDSSSKQLECQTKRGLHWQGEEQIESRNHGKEGEPKQKPKLEEKSSDITCSGSNRETKQKSLSTEVYEKGERYPSFGGARNFYLGGAEEYTKSQNSRDNIGKKGGKIQLLSYDVEEHECNYSP